MKIMILIPSFISSSPIEHAFLFAKYLQKNNKKVLIVSIDNKYNSRKNIVDEIIKEGLEFHCLNIKGWYGLLMYSKFITQKFVKEKKIDVILSYLLRPTLVTSLISYSNIIKIASVRGIFSKNYALNLGKIISKIPSFIEINALKKMDYILCLTESMRNWLISKKISQDKIGVVNNFVDVQKIKLYSSSIKNKSNDCINIGMFCNFVPLKRIDIALRACDILINKYKNNKIKLHLVGDGPCYNDMVKFSQKLGLNEKNVIFHGYLSDPLMLMSEMNIVILTSESEGLPRCLMEALSLGKTVVATDIPGNNELIINRITGYLFPVNDAEKLAYLINYIIENNAYLPTERLINYMSKNYDIEICCKKMLNLIENFYYIKKYG